jgi:hypothetical protein
MNCVFTGGNMMGKQDSIRVCSKEGERLNGLGMMMLQYLEQNFTDFEYKVKEGLRIRGSFVTEVDGGVAVTISFNGATVLLENGVAENSDLHLISSYLMLSNVLSGKANPFCGVIRGNIRMMFMPKRPIQAIRLLRLLKVPSDFIAKNEKGDSAEDI